jgi:cell division protein FtsN
MLFGLAVALGVAVYITKVPMPFMNKAQTPPVDEAGDLKKGKDWDPNAGLPGRVAKPEADASAPASAPAPTGEAPVAAKPADPLGDLAKSRAESKPVASPSAPVAPAAPVPPAPPVAPAAPMAPVAPVPPPASAAPAVNTDPFPYVVQAGAYRTPEDAAQQRAKLSLMGLQARITELDQAGRMVYRVRLGPFERREEADKARDSLVGNNIEAVVVRLQR